MKMKTFGSFRVPPPRRATSLPGRQVRACVAAWPCGVQCSACIYSTANLAAYVAMKKEGRK